MTKEFIYNNTPVLFNVTNQNVFVNATQMAKPFNKKVAHWLENKNTKDFLNSLCVEHKLNRNQLIIIKKGGNSLQGTFMHPIVAKKFSQWVGINCYKVFSNLFSEMCSSDIIIDNYNNRENSTEFVFGKNILQKLFKDFEIVYQHSVLNNKYKLDWYIPELNLAIEFNEKHHKNQKEKDKQRKKEIETSINCKIIEFNDFN